MATRTGAVADGGYGHEVAQWLAAACAAVIGAAGGVVAASEGEGRGE